MKNFVIYLPKYNTSKTWAAVAKETGCQHGWDIELYEGVDGTTVNDDNAWSKWGIKINDQDSKCQKLMNRAGVRGCFLSHYNLWHKCVDLNEPIGIFEHDVKFLSGPPVIDSIKDLLKLEGFTENKPRPAGVWYEGARAYIITPQGANKLITWVEKNGCLPADVIIGADVLSIEFDKSGRVITVNQPTSRKERHTNSFTWNLEGMT